MKISTIAIASGPLGTLQTLRIMGSVAIRASKTDIIKNMSASLGSVEAIDKYVRLHFKYQTEPYEMVIAPEQAAEFIRDYGFFSGDCDDSSTFLAALFICKKLPVVFEAIKAHNRKDFTHVYCKVYVPNTGWIISDATVNPGIVYKHFGVLQWRVN